MNLRHNILPQFEAEKCALKFILNQSMRYHFPISKLELTTTPLFYYNIAIFYGTYATYNAW